MLNTREEILAAFRNVMPELVEQFDVKSLAIFGSASRNELKADSDIDVLITYRGMADLDKFFGAKERLEEVSGRRIDLATPRMLKLRLAQ